MKLATYVKSSDAAKGDGFSESTTAVRIARLRTSVNVDTSAGMSKKSLRHSLYVSSRTGKDPYFAATASRSLALLRCCQSGARIPGRRLGRRRERAAFSRN